MCMEDIRLGRKSISAPKTIIVPVAPGVIILGTNEKRIGFMISNDGVLAAMYGPKGMDLLAAQGMPLNAGKPMDFWSVETIGFAVCGEWFALGVAGPVTLSIVEVLLQDT